MINRNSQCYLRLCIAYMILQILLDSTSFALTYPQLENEMQQDTEDTSQFTPPSFQNSFGFGGNLYVSALWTLGGTGGEKPMFSSSYRRQISENEEIGIQARYMNVFLNRENIISGTGYPLRWLNTIWGTDLLYIFKPLPKILPKFRLGIGPSLDFISTLRTIYTQTFPNDPTKILKEQNYYLVSYLGAIVNMEYAIFSPDRVDMGLHIQINVQTALSPRPFYVLPYPISGGLLFGFYVRAKF